MSRHCAIVLPRQFRRARVLPVFAATDRVRGRGRHEQQIRITLPPQRQNGLSSVFHHSSRRLADLAA
eukprot:13167-Eustigmatos_ZCMA.PRE.1